MARQLKHNRKRPTKRDSQQARHPTMRRFDNPPPNLASLIRGLYRRVSQTLKVHPSYVSRVARGERRSEAVENEIRSELRKIVNSFHPRSRSKSGTRAPRSRSRSTH